MKKISSIIAIVLCVVLSLPIVSNAEDNSVHIITQFSVDGFNSDSDLNIAQKYITSYLPLNTDVYPDMATLYNYIDSYTFDSTYDYYLIYVSRYSGTLCIVEFNSSQSGIPFVVVETSSLPNENFGNTSYTVDLFFNRVNASWYGGKGGTLTFNAISPTWEYQENFVFAGNGNSGVAISNQSQWQILAGNIPVYMNWDIINKGGSAIGSSSFDFYSADKSSYYNFLNADLPYLNSDGEIINPSGSVSIETNSNHMYFKSCDLGFCEPYGMNDFSNFGGAYLYCKYTVDDWVVNHINDYSLQFNVTSVIGQQQNNFSYTARLDRNGIVTVPFSSIFVSNSPSAIPKNNSFVACVSSKKLNDDYNIANLYTLSESNLTNWLNATKSYTTFSFSGLGWSVLQGKEIQYIVACINDAGTHSLNNGQNANTLVQINPYIFRVSVKLIDSEQNLSGEYAEKFDLFTGDTSTVNSDGLVNDDPFVPDIVPDDPDSLPIVPDDQGNSTIPVTVINNGGSWSGTATITYDPGYRDLRDDVISSENDWGQYFYPFKDSNGVGEMFGSFLDNMPSELKVIFIGGFGVLTCFAIYRFIRRG